MATQLPPTPPNTDVLSGLTGLKFAQAWWQWLSSVGQAIVSMLASITSIQAGLPFRGVQVFLASGTFTPGAGVNKVFAEVWAGGGGSGGTNAGTTNGAGGGGGGYANGILAVTPGVGVTATVGGGGGGGVAGGGGGTGGTSSFGSMTCFGGNPSPGATGGIAGGTGGGASGGDVNITGAAGGQNNYSNAGAVLTSGAGGTAYGGPATAGANGGGYFPGGGGMGQVSANSIGFPGAQGMIVVRW